MSDSEKNVRMILAAVIVTGAMAMPWHPTKDIHMGWVLTFVLLGLSIGFLTQLSNAFAWALHIFPAVRRALLSVLPNAVERRSRDRPSNADWKSQTSTGAGTHVRRRVDHESH